eukprot:6776177-Prymnesium_polylepis.1
MTQRKNIVDGPMTWLDSPQARKRLLIQAMSVGTIGLGTDPTRLSALKSIHRSCLASKVELVPIRNLCTGGSISNSIRHAR